MKKRKLKKDQAKKIYRYNRSKIDLELSKRYAKVYTHSFSLVNNKKGEK